MHFTRGARTLVLTSLLIGGLPGGLFAQAQDPYYQFLMGRHLATEGDASGALSALERAAQADPRSAEVRAEIAALQYGRKQHAVAEREAKAALAIDDRNMEAHRVLGQIYADAAGNERNTAAQTAAYQRDALTHLERAMSGAQGLVDPNLVFLIGQLYLATDQPAKAVQAFERVVNQNPNNPTARLQLAQAYAANKDTKSAIATLQEIAEEAPGVLPALGQLQYSAGFFAEAADTYTRVLETQPNSARVKAQRILSLYEAKMYPQAVTAAVNAQRQHPDEPSFPRLQASALYKSGDSGRAIEVLETSLTKFPRDAQSQLALADLYSEAGRSPDAEKILRQMIALDPKNANALNYLGYLLAQQSRNLEEAIGLVSRALQVDPDNGAFLDSLGWAHFQRGDFGEAEKFLGRAAELMPDNSEILDHLGDLYAARGRLQDAITAWSRALKGNGDSIDPAAVQRKIDNARGKSGR